MYVERSLDHSVVHSVRIPVEISITEYFLKRKFMCAALSILSIKFESVIRKTIISRNSDLVFISYSYMFYVSLQSGKKTDILAYLKEFSGYNYTHKNQGHS